MVIGLQQAKKMLEKTLLKRRLLKVLERKVAASTIRIESTQIKTNQENIHQTPQEETNLMTEIKEILPIMTININKKKLREVLENLELIMMRIVMLVMNKEYPIIKSKTLVGPLNLPEAKVPLNLKRGKNHQTAKIINLIPKTFMWHKIQTRLLIHQTQD